MDIENIFRLVEHLSWQDLKLNPLWTTVDDPDDQVAILGYGVQQSNLLRMLNGFDGWSEGYTHPWYPILDMSREAMPELIRTDFWLSNGMKQPGYLIDDHCFGVFVGENDYVFNRNLPDMMKEEALRLSADNSLPDTPFPIRYEAALDPVAPISRAGTIEAIW